MRRESRRFLPAALAVVLTVMAAFPLLAQRPQTREGFWIGFGFGYGGLDITCDGCEVDRESGVSGYLKLGGTLNPGLLLGVQSLGWYKDIEGVKISQGSLTGNVWWYPNPAGGFWVTGGAGVSRLELDAGPLGSESETGFAALGGLGYDIRVGRNISIVPSATWQFGFYEDGGANVLQLALGITFH